jgi:hypothetical protein
MVQGGAIVFGSPYTLRTVDSFKGKEADVSDYLTATRINNTPSESIGQAVILTTDSGKFKDLASVDIDKVVGVSWYAAAKIMEEVIRDKTENALSPILFTVGAPDDTKISNNAKIALIAFIHGVHAYGIVVGSAAKSMGFKERYDAVVEYIKQVQEDKSKGTERGHIQGIWNALMEQYGLNRDATTLDKIITNLDYKNIMGFLGTPAASAPSTASEEDPVASKMEKQPIDPLSILFEIPTKFPIQEVLGKTK